MRSKNHMAPIEGIETCRVYSTLLVHAVVRIKMPRLRGLKLSLIYIALWIQPGKNQNAPIEGIETNTPRTSRARRLR